MRKDNKAFTIPLALALTVGASAYAGRPLAIDDADPVDQGQFEFEMGATCEHDSDCKHWDYPAGLTCGLVSGVEVGVGFGGQFEERTERIEDSDTEVCTREHGIGDLVIGAKWRFLGESAWYPRQALVPSIKFPTADDTKGLGSGKTDYDLTWIASKNMGEKIGLHINVGYSWIGELEGEDVGDMLHYGVAADYQILNAVQWVGEVFIGKELRSGTDTTAQYNTGFRWNPLERLTVDIAGGSKISGDVPDFTATAGLTWAFGFNKNNQNQGN
jgi:hypothetical protein